MEPREHSVFIGLGSNLGERFGYLQQAVDLIEASLDCSVVKMSSVYETKPFGIKNQNNFLNAVIQIKTSLTLHLLLDFLKAIEQKLGRQKREKWECREIDLDILFYDSLIYSDERVSVPHPYITVRDFVLVPLCEIAPGFIYPVTKKPLCEIMLPENEEYIITAIASQLRTKEIYGVSER